jgi:uncharacterized membrane protein YphA (DoxX/SURF4 family)
VTKEQSNGPEASRIDAAVARVDAVSGRYGPVAVRWLLGLLWLSNVNWKVPTEFGGLRNFVQAGVDHPVVPGSAWVFEHIVLTGMPAFGWVTLVAEVGVAATLLSGRFPRTSALVSAALSVGIGLAVANAPGEWYWAYLLMLGLSLAVLVQAPGHRPHSARLLGSVVVAYGGVVALANGAAGLTGDDNVTRTLFTGRNDIPDEFGVSMFAGSVALGGAFVVLGVAAVGLAGASPTLRRWVGWATVAVALVALFTYRGGPDTLVVGLGSRAVHCGVLAALGLSLLPVRRPPDGRTDADDTPDDTPTDTPTDAATDADTDADTDAATDVAGER